MSLMKKFVFNFDRETRIIVIVEDMKSPKEDNDELVQHSPSSVYVVYRR